MSKSLLPPNATAQEIALDLATARIGDPAVPIATLWNPATCPASHLPWLAWALSVDTWNPDWPESVKRQVIAATYVVHSVKGTLGALRRALEALDLDGVDITEWFDYAGDPYLFRVDVELSTRGLTETEYADIEAAIKAAKNVRSHLDRLRVFLTNRSTTPYVAVAMAGGQTVSVYPYAVSEIEVSGVAPVVAVAQYGAHTITIYPAA